MATRRVKMQDEVKDAPPPVDTPDVTGSSVVRAVQSQVYVVTSTRFRDGKFQVQLEYSWRGRSYTMTLPDNVLRAMLRQRDTLIAKGRRRAAKAAAAKRKALGIVTGFKKKQA